MSCPICGKNKPNKFTIRTSWVQAGGFGIVPLSARVHPKCDDKEQELITSGKLKPQDIWKPKITKEEN